MHKKFVVKKSKGKRLCGRFSCGWGVNTEVDLWETGCGLYSPGSG